MVGGNNDFGIHLRECGKDLADARMEEPGARQSAKGCLVACQLAHHPRLGAGVGEDVDEVDDNHVERCSGQLCARRQQAVHIGGSVYLVVGEGFAAAIPFEQMADEGFLVEVLALFFLFLHPKVGIMAAYLQGHHACEDGVAGVLGGCGEDGEVQVFVNVERGLEFVGQHAPLVEAAVVQHEQTYVFAFAETGKDAPFHHVGADKRALAGGGGYPRFVVAPNVFGEGQIGLFLLHPQHIGHRPARFGEFQFPAHQAFVEFYPLVGRQAVANLHAYLGKLAAVGRLRHLAHDFALVDILLQGHENLVGIDGFDKVVGNLGSDGLVHQVFGLVLRHHNHGHGGADFLDACQGFQSAEAGHILVEEDEVVVVFAAQFDGVRPVRGGRHVIILAAQEYHVCLEQIYLVIYPKEASIRHSPIFMYARVPIIYTRARISQNCACEVRHFLGVIGTSLGVSCLRGAICLRFRPETWAPRPIIRASQPIIMPPNGSFGNNCYLCKKYFSKNDSSARHPQILWPSGGAQGY